MPIITRSSTFLGVASWLVPFVASFLFVGPGAVLFVPQPLFKSLMVVIGGGVGTALLVRALRTQAPTARSGLLLGLYWLAINFALDLAVLVPLAGMTVPGYLSDIGLRYLLLPIIATGLGTIAKRTARPQS